MFRSATYVGLLGVGVLGVFDEGVVEGKQEESLLAPMVIWNVFQPCKLSLSKKNK